MARRAASVNAVASEVESSRLAVVYRKTADLIPYARNARTHSDEQVAQIAASIREFGFTNPVLLDGQNGLLAGHGRLAAARLLGLAEVPTIDLAHLSETQRRAYILADNKLALNAGWDSQLLALELEELQALDFDVALTGFSTEEIGNIAAEAIPAVQGQTDEDAVPEVQAEAVTRLGDVWLLGKHRVMCGDSTSIDAVEKLMAGEKADMVFTDPPYGVDYDGGHATEKRREKLKNDDALSMYDLPLQNAYIVSKPDAPLYLWFADRFAGAVLEGLSAAGYQVRSWLIWNKNLAQFGALGAQYKTKHEPCIYAFKRGNAPNWIGPTNEVSVWDVARESRNAYHPTQKPVELAKRAIGNHAVSLVLDLFLGSGATLIACEQMQRACCGMELDGRYCDVIVRRWQEFTGQTATLEGDGRTFAEVAAAEKRAA